MESKYFNLILVSLDKFKKFDSISSFSVNTTKGEITILPGHSDFITTLQEEQDIKIISNNIEYNYHITDAMLSVHNGEVRISVNKFE